MICFGLWKVNADAEDTLIRIYQEREDAEKVIATTRQTLEELGIDVELNFDLKEHEFVASVGTRAGRKNREYPHEFEVFWKALPEGDRKKKSKKFEEWQARQ